MTKTTLRRKSKEWKQGVPMRLDADQAPGRGNTSWLLSLKADGPCFLFTTVYHGVQYSTVFELGGANSEKGAVKKAEKTIRWLQEFGFDVKMGRCR